MKSHYTGSVKGNEKSTKRFLDAFNPVKKAVYGAYGYPDYANNSVALLSFCCSYYNKDSKYFKDDNLFFTMDCVIDYLYSAHRPDFSVDNRESDYFAPPLILTAYICHAYKVMEMYAKSEKEILLFQKLKEYMELPAKGICNGGIITPNHRWMTVSAAFMLYEITGIERLNQIAHAYLNEGIDMNEFGEYSERSPMYNKECDEAMIVTYLHTKKDEYMNYVKRNLDLMFYYIEPDFSLFTQNSNRKDKKEGDTSETFYPYGYYYSYLYASYITKNPQYAKMADDIYNHYVNNYGYGLDFLWLYMLEPDFCKYAPVFFDYPHSYDIFHKDIVRKRADDFSVTLLCNSPNFLFVQNGSLKCFVRICASFFAVAQFIPASIEKIANDTYHMTMTATGRYVGPMSEKPDTTDRYKMDRSKRPVIKEPTLCWDVTVTLKEDSVDLDFYSKGCDQVPYKVEFCISGKDNIIDVKNNGVQYQGKRGEFLTFDQGIIDLSYKSDILRLSGTHQGHTYHRMMRGSVPPALSCFTIYYTGFTHARCFMNISKIGEKDA